jgi:acetylornithine deacetylase/succinyl-diaminopimelate desuccinylase-like protein
MEIRSRGLLIAALVVSTSVSTGAQQSNNAAFEAETIQHFQALLKIDTSSPPGNETKAVDYLKSVFEKEGIPYQVFAKDPSRANIVARIKGNGKRNHPDPRPHRRRHDRSDQVDASAFGAVRDGGYVYGRGTVDDKDNLVAGLMLMLNLKRNNTPLDRDVILLAESGEEGAPDVGAQFMADNHLDAISAEFCFAEGGGVVRRGGQVVQSNIGTTEKEPRFVEIIAHGPAGHGSVPSKGNAVTRLTAAVGKIAEWTPPLHINETTGAYFKKLATMVPADVAKVYRDILNPDPKVSKGASDWLLENQPNHWSMVHTSLVPTIVTGGFRYNVIPSEAKATIDVRLHPDEDQSTFLDMVRKVVNDPNVEVRWGRERYRPAGGARIDTEAYRVLEAQTTKHYNTTVLPTMGTGATDMSNLRAKGIECYGIGPALDSEDGGKGFGAHSDQERILESELHRFVRFQQDVVLELARAR